MATETTVAEIDYPSGDGKPMAETGLHVRANMLLHQALEDFFHGRPDVFIDSGIFWFWEEGNPDARVAPDVMVATGLAPREPRERRSLFSRQEGGKIPSVVFEMVSKSTWREDVEEKHDRYESLGVREYFLFDPEGLYLVPSLQGYRLRGSTYRRIRSDRMESELGFGMRVEDLMLRLIDLQTGQLIPTRVEAVAAGRQLSERLKSEAAHADERAEALRLKATAAQLRAGCSLQSEVERSQALLKNYGHANGKGF